MPRPRKPIALHLIQNTYRRDRHGPLPATPYQTPLTQAEPELSPAEAALRAEVERWRGVFDSGYDFFSELAPLGIVDPTSVWPPEGRPAAERAFLAAARAAWERLGAAFLAQWTPDEHDDDDEMPWALETFGDSSGPLKKPRKLRR